ncbi:hypothetical protein EMPS_00923 [Entomortierella parvispora]|uniref:MYND-type domain-containing protein n=1 Tax=Entomortierella parvispora TaxID=205924 RepID=A0A9P3H1Z3_9FUNG|nr:hypothetical protein EMPS_00923 [Entomortierella parvispora]
MREPNVMFPLQNRAAICITSTNYDRRALDCTAYLPIINSLTNLAYLTGSSPTIRDILTRDGGLECLVTILKNTKVRDRKNGLKWTLAFQCVVNIGVRGTEQVRKRVVQAGMVPVIVNLLESFFSLLKTVSEENERKRLQRKLEHQQQQQQQSQPLDSSATSPMSPSNTRIDAALADASPSPLAEDMNTNTRVPVRNSPYRSPVAAAATTVGGVTSLASLDEASQHPVTSEATRSIHNDTNPQFFYSEDDILHALQLLAYLSKYPSLRNSFLTETGPNVFAIVEKFTHRTLHPLEIQYWAGVIMRNACRKDETRQGIRQCAYTGCGKWETKPREFAKCRRCRKAKYCSKPCQSKAWSEGHRWWCVEKRADAMGVSTSYGTDLPPGPPPPPPPADLQDQPDGNTNLMQGGSIPSGGSGAAGARIIGGGDNGNSSSGHSSTSHSHDSHHHHSRHITPAPALQSTQPPAAAPQPAPRPLPSMQSRQPNQPSPFQGPRQEMRPHAPLQPSSLRSVAQPPQRSMTHPNFSTAPASTSPIAPVTQHLGVLPNSPTPEQLAQAFVQQVALYPGRHNELAQQLNAQFQQHFPPHHQSEAKRLFSFHAREHFARYQRQQDLLRSRSQASFTATAASVSSNGATSSPLPNPALTAPRPRHGHAASEHGRAGSSSSLMHGTPRRRSDLDTDDEEAGPSSAPQQRLAHSSAMSIPMLTQDLTTSMTLHSGELSAGPSSSVLLTNPFTSPAPTASSSNSTAVTRDYKVRKVMAREESEASVGGSSSSSSSSASSSSAWASNQAPSREGNGWSYSRQLAKDTPAP